MKDVNSTRTVLFKGLYNVILGKFIQTLNRYSKKVPYTVLRNDDAVHAVNDNVTGITAYVCYSAYERSEDVKTALAAFEKGKDAKPALPVSEITSETIVMERALGDGRSVMSICTPDLGITKKGYTTAQESQPLVRSVTLDGTYAVEGTHDNVEVTVSGGKTTVNATCLHGQPVEFILARQ